MDHKSHAVEHNRTDSSKINVFLICKIKFNKIFNIPNLFFLKQI